jgi:hypothetical protein
LCALCTDSCSSQAGITDIALRALCGSSQAVATDIALRGYSQAGITDIALRALGRLLKDAPGRQGDLRGSKAGLREEGSSCGDEERLID